MEITYYNPINRQAAHIYIYILLFLFCKFLVIRASFTMILG